MKRAVVSGLLALACLFSTGMVGAMDRLNGLNVFGTDSWQQIIAAEQGKPFVVLVWSLDCAYCEQSFAALSAARRKYGLSIVTIATDRADDVQNADLIHRRLAAGGLRANNWAFGDAPAEQLRYLIDPMWRGEMPRSYWFNARGERVAHSGVITAQIVDKLAPR